MTSQRKFKFRIEATKGMAVTVGVCCVKVNGKIERYFASFEEADDWVQSALYAEQAA